MAKESGVNVLLKIGDGGDPETFTSLAGQKSTRMTGAASPIDTSDKTTGGWGSTLPGTRSMTISCSGVAHWPDQLGVHRVRAAWEAGEDITCELVLNSAGDKYTVPLSVTQCDIGGDDDSATEYSFTLQNASAPTFTAGT